MAGKKTIKKKSMKGAEYICRICGLEVRINNVCSCDECDLVCCGQLMVPKKKKK